MSVLHLRPWLSLLSAALVVGSVVVLAWAVVAPPAVDASSARPKQNADDERPSGTRGNATPTLPKPLLTLRLQRPLFDPPPPKPTPVTKKETPPPPIKLLATMPEPNGGCAMFSDSGGATTIKSLGEHVVAGPPPVVLIEIANDHVVLRREGELITLKLPQ